MNSTADFAKDITILCKVVDNFGDIGFAYRLARSLLELDSHLHIRMIVDDLHAFSLIANSKKNASNIDSTLPFQKFKNIFVYDWNVSDVCSKEFSNRPPTTILQCFQCGYPEWLENILFEKNCSANNTVQVINIDYLTAEPYAEEFHLLNSLTRSARVKKINFMPGFTNKTGGLLTMDVKKFLPATQKPSYNIFLFAYEQDFLPLITAVKNFQRKINHCDCEKKIYLHVAAGKNQTKFLDDWARACKPFSVNALSFMSQEEWDEYLPSMDLLFVRGEESLSQSCLLGIPFVWQAYIQDDDYQLVKVNALLQVMKPFFSKAHFSILENAWTLYNTTQTSEHLAQKSKVVETFLENAESMRSSFVAFAKMLYTNGDFAAKLLEYLDYTRSPSKRFL